MLSINHFSTENYFLVPHAFEVDNLSFVIMVLTDKSIDYDP